MRRIKTCGQSGLNSPEWHARRPRKSSSRLWTSAEPIDVADATFITFLFRRSFILAAFGSPDWRDRKGREWLLLLLRFAVTREPSDRAAALAVADELDSLGMRRTQTVPSFFVRTSNEVCEAILAAGGRHDVDDGHDGAVLRRHVARFDDP